MIDFNQHRRNRTQAMLDEACDRARHGEKVLVLVHDAATATYFRNHIDRFANAKDLQISIRSVTDGPAPHIAHQWNAVLIDHYVHEHANIPSLDSLLAFIKTRIVPAKR